MNVDCSHPHPHVRCVSLQVASAERNNQRADTTNEIPLTLRLCVITFPVSSLCLYATVFPEESGAQSRPASGGSTLRPRRGPASVCSAYGDFFSPAETSHLVHLQTTLQVEKLGVGRVGGWGGLDGGLSCKH